MTDDCPVTFGELVVRFPLLVGDMGADLDDTTAPPPETLTRGDSRDLET